jgi:hypothetical protein
MQHFVRRSTSLHVILLEGGRGENSCNVFLLFSMALWVPIFVTPCGRAALMLWHACPFLGLKFFPPFFSLIGGLFL